MVYVVEEQSNKISFINTIYSFIYLGEYVYLFIYSYFSKKTEKEVDNGMKRKKKIVKC